MSSCRPLQASGTGSITAAMARPCGMQTWADEPLFPGCDTTLDTQVMSSTWGLAEQKACRRRKMGPLSPWLCHDSRSFASGAAKSSHVHV